jgi:Domain of unknown function (DUF4349)
MQIHGTPRAGRPALLIVVAVVAIVLAACSSGAATLSTVGAAVPADEYSGGEAPAVAAPVAAPASAAPSAGSPQSIGSVDDAKIVRTGTMTLDVKDVGAAVDAARTAILGLGGYIGASNTSDDGDQPVAEITYRIPVARWEDALTALHTLNGQTTKVVVEKTDAVEVTSQVVDLDARIRNLRASETALQGIAANATKISDVLEVQSQLTDVRGQIEELTAQLNDLGDRASYATMTTTFRVPVIAVEQAKKGWDPSTIVDDASASTISIVQGLAGAGIWFAIVWLPILIALIVGGGLLLWIGRRTGLTRRARRFFTPTPPTPPSGWVAPGG